MSFNYNRVTIAGNLTRDPEVRFLAKVEITDPALVPDEIAGVALWVIDTKAIERLAKSGVQIPGVTVSEVQTIAAKG